MGPSYLAQKIMELDEEYLVFAFSQLILVIDGQALIERHLANQYDRKNDYEEKVIEGSYYHEFHPYWVFSKYSDSWDSILALLVALEDEHFEFFHRLMERIEYASSDYIEDHGGLSRVLSEEERLFSDIAFEREQKLEAHGHVTPEKGAMFLNSIWELSFEDILTGGVTDYFVKNYFENITVEHTSQLEETKDLELFIEFLAEAEILPNHIARPLLGDGGQEHSSIKYKIQHELEELGLRDDALYEKCLLELSFLANTLMASSSIEGRRFRETEAAEAAIAVSNLGRDYLIMNKLNRDPIDIIQSFKLGWKLLYSEVTVPACNMLIEKLEAPLDSSDVFIKKNILRIAKSLKENLTRKRPWKSLEYFDLLETIIDQEKVYFLKMLIAECPRYNEKYLATCNDLKMAKQALSCLFI